MSYAIAAETEQPRCIELGMSSIPVFAELPDGREQAVKVLEEAAELFAEVRAGNHRRILDEACDVIQAVCNLLAAHGMDDIELELHDMVRRNEARGREYA